MDEQNLNLDEVAKHSLRNKAELMKSKVCGCYYCLTIFSPTEFGEDDWIPGENTALCPHCMVDSVIGDASGYAITKELLEKLHKRSF